MIHWIKSLLKSKPKAPETGDMRDTPVDNPLDYREDGSIRKGDPAYDFMMEVMESGEASIATQKPDGTWETTSPK